MERRPYDYQMKAHKEMVDKMTSRQEKNKAQDKTRRKKQRTLTWHPPKSEVEEFLAKKSRIAQESDLLKKRKQNELLAAEERYMIQKKKEGSIRKQAIYDYPQEFLDKGELKELKKASKEESIKKYSRDEKKFSEKKTKGDKPKSPSGKKESIRYKKII